MSHLNSTSSQYTLFVVYQRAQFSSCAKCSHKEAMKCAGRCLKRTKDKGIICNSDSTKGIIVHIDTDFAYSWTSSDSHYLLSALSRNVCVIKVVNCPMCWISKTQPEVVLSATEAEYVELSQSVRFITFITNII